MIKQVRSISLLLLVVLVVLVVTALAGCDRQPPAMVFSAEDARTELDNVIASHGACTFAEERIDGGARSIVLLPEGQAVLLLEYVQGGKGYPGQYTITSTSITNLDFPGSGVSLPDLLIGKDKTSLFVAPESIDAPRGVPDLAWIMRAIPDNEQAGAAGLAKLYIKDQDKTPATTNGEE